MASPNELTVHIALSTLPNTHYGEFVNDIETNFYKKFLEGTKSYYHAYKEELTKHKGQTILYNPLKYFIFGNYDIAFISLIDRFKFAQKLFAPVNEHVLNPATFQIITGITHYPKSDDLKDLISTLHADKMGKKFVGIINLKLNNGLAIGNGNFFLDSVVSLTKDILDKKFTGVEYIIFQSFSWFELSLVTFYNDPQILARILRELREQTIRKIDESDKVVQSSIYFEELSNNPDLSTIPKEIKIERIKNTHVFSDSQTYMGINWDLLTSTFDCNNNPFKDIQLKTEIEWMVSPGHNNNLLELLTNNPELNEVFDVKKAWSVLGKSDYLIPAVNDSVQNNFRLFQFIYKKNDFHPYVKKIKTRVLFTPEFQNGNTNGHEKSSEEVNSIIDSSLLKKNFGNLALTNNEITSIDKALKELKISRLVRTKVRKVLFNYNSGIQDPILCTFFLDFVLFIKDLNSRIVKEHKKLEVFTDPHKYKATADKGNFDAFENYLIQLIEGFEENFSVRILNSYQFEDINDFDLDFNASVQQLLSAYNTLALEVANIYYPAYSQGLLVQLNFKNIIANYYFINYNVYHLTTPEVVFFTITKEVLNYYYLNLASKELQEQHKNTKDQIYAFLSAKSSFLDDAIKTKKLDLDYLFLDMIRLIITCNSDFDHFSHWLWSYNSQNSSIFTTYGTMEENHFITEICRFVLLAKLYDIPSERLKCPILELEPLWDKYFYILDKELKNCFDKEINENKEFLKLITKYNLNIYGLIDQALVSTGQPNDEIYSTWLTKFNGLGAIKNTCQDTSKALDFLGDIVREQNVSNETLINLNNFIKCQNLFFNKFVGVIREGKPVLYSKEEFGNPSMYISALIFTYLKVIYEENNRTIYFLRRNRATGMPVMPVVRSGSHDTIKQKTALYYVDPTGGTFFIDQAQQHKYFIIRNGILQALLHFACYQKKQLITTIVKTFR